MQKKATGEGRTWVTSRASIAALPACARVAGESQDTRCVVQGTMGQDVPSAAKAMGCRRESARSARTARRKRWPTSCSCLCWGWGWWFCGTGSRCVPSLCRATGWSQESGAAAWHAAPSHCSRLSRTLSPTFATPVAPPRSWSGLAPCRACFQTDSRGVPASALGRLSVESSA
eukprot:743007-Rhodomonas_salina.1